MRPILLFGGYTPTVIMQRLRQEACDGLGSPDNPELLPPKPVPLEPRPFIEHFQRFGCPQIHLNP